MDAGSRRQAGGGRRAFPILALVVVGIHALGCATSSQNSPHFASNPSPSRQPDPVQLVAFDRADNATWEERLPAAPVPALDPGGSRDELESLAQSLNPTLIRLSQEAAAAEARAVHISKLPDPTVGSNFFLHPIETAAGSQRANLSVMQVIPWLSRLDAQSQQACLEAMAAQQAFEAERLRVVGEVRVLWSRLYVIGKQIEASRANQQILTPLIEVANARVSTGQAAQGDVLLGTLELGRLEEEILSLNQRLETAKTELNRVVGREVSHPITVPTELVESPRDWSFEQLRDLAWQNQPAILAAELQLQATNWGVEVARLKRRPQLSFSASWFAIDDNRPGTSLVDVGRDAWALGAQVSVPLWHRKYDAIEQEAAWRHMASHANADELRQRYSALVRDLLEQVRTARATADLYLDTLLPQARQTLEADEQSYANGAVEFDRVLRDLRSVLLLETGFHQALGQVSAGAARLQQAVGGDLVGLEPELLPPPIESEPGGDVAR